MQTKKQKQVRLNHYNIIDRLLKDDAAITGKSESQLIEEIIIDHYASKKSLPLLRSVYEEGKDMGYILSGVWCDAAIGYSQDWLDVINYAVVISRMGNDLPDSSREEWHHFIGLLESLYLYLETANKKNPNPDTQKDMEWIAEVIDKYKNGNPKIGMYTIYQVIINNYDDLKELPKIYNLLQSMCIIQTSWKDEPVARIELFKLLKKQRV